MLIVIPTALGIGFFLGRPGQWSGTDLSAARGALDAADLGAEERKKLQKELE